MYSNTNIYGIICLGVDNMKKIGDLIKEYRQESGMTLREFARKCEVSHAYIDKLEKGIDPRNDKEVAPSIAMTIRIASAMKMSFVKLLIETGYIKKLSRNYSLKCSSNNFFIHYLKTNEGDIDSILKNLFYYILNDKNITIDKAPFDSSARELLVQHIEFALKQTSKANQHYLEQQQEKNNI